MPVKSKKSKKVGKKGSGKSKGKKAAKSKSKKKNISKKAIDPAERESALSKALEAHLYFQRAELSSKDLQLQRAHELQTNAEKELEILKDTMEEAGAFTAWQHEHTVERLTDRLEELTIANKKLKEERDDLQTRLNDSIEEANTFLAAKDAEIAKLSNVIKESHYKYERIFSLFADRLVEKLTETWENEKPFLQDLEDCACDEFLQNGLLSTFDD
ncbi:hypothetical protein Aperf_G00000078537 [Anoplocephala perfoliata]